MNNAKPIDRRNEILLMAETLFATHGYSGTTLNMIAEAAGIRRPSLLHYYKDKVTLYKNVLGRMFEEQSQRLLDIDGREYPTLNSKIDALLVEFVSYGLENPNYLRILTYNLVSGIDPDDVFKELSYTSRTVWRIVLEAKAKEAGLKKFNPYQAIAMVSGSLSFLVEMTGNESPGKKPRLNKDRVIKQLRRILEVALSN